MRTTLTALTLAAALAGTAQADVHTFDWERGDSVSGLQLEDYAGRWESIHATYNDVTHELHWEATWSEYGTYNRIPDGFSLVINNGPMPPICSQATGLFPQ